MAAAVVIFVVLLGLIWALGSRSNKPDQSREIKTETSLTNFAQTPTTVRYTFEGRINGREDHRVVQITVGQSTRTIQVFYGYEGSVLRSQTFLNDVDAYRAFLAALDNSGYTNARIASRNVDPLAACPLGNRAHYDIIDGSDTKQSLWSANCKGVKGTFAGKASTVQALFERQVPEYEEFMKGIKF